MYKLAIIGVIGVLSVAFTLSSDDQGKQEKPTKKNTHVSNSKGPNNAKDKENHNPATSVFDQGKNENKGGSDHGNRKNNNHFPINQKNGPQSNEDKSHKKDHHNDNKQEVGHKKNGNNPSNKHSNGQFEKGSKMHFAKGHPNFGYVYVNEHGYFSHKNYGQWRSEQARMKHKNYKPKYEYQAIQGFQLIISRNVFLFTETDFKINLLTVNLAEKRKLNQITLVQYDTYTRRIELLQKRRAALQINITL